MAQPQGPQGPPPADSQGDSQQGGPQEGGQDQGGGEITKLISNIGGGLQHLEQVFMASNALPPKDKQLISQIVQMYGELVESLSGQEQDDGGQEGQAQGQPSPMEAGGNKGAIPAPGQ